MKSENRREERKKLWRKEGGGDSFQRKKISSARYRFHYLNPFSLIKFFFYLLSEKFYRGNCFQHFQSSSIYFLLSYCRLLLFYRMWKCHGEKNFKNAKTFNGNLYKIFYLARYFYLNPMQAINRPKDTCAVSESELSYFYSCSTIHASQIITFGLPFLRFW